MFRLASLCARTPSSVSLRTSVTRGHYREYAVSRNPVIAEAQRTCTFLEPEEASRRVLAVIKAFDKVDPAKVTPTAHFTKDLGIDSLDTVELLLNIEDEFAIEMPAISVEQIISCDAAIEYISSHPYAK